MNSKLPPVPEDNRSHKGPGEPPTANVSQEASGRQAQDPNKQGQQGNTKVNTTHQGYQQDR
jgi:hypothetical protein